jgi:hypothetical protein
VYWLNSAVWQVGHLQIVCIEPSSRGTSTAAGSPVTTSNNVVSINMLMTNALPVCRWQFRQWQQWTMSGSDINR